MARVEEIDKTLEDAKKVRPKLSSAGAEIVLPLLQSIEPAIRKRVDLAHFPTQRSDQATETMAERNSGQKLLALLDNAMELVRDIGHEAESPLMAALTDTSLCVRSQAALFLGMAAVRSKASVRQLGRVARNNDEHRAVRLAAAASLVNSADTDEDTWNEMARFLKSWADKAFPLWESGAKGQGMHAQEALTTMAQGSIPHLIVAALTQREEHQQNPPRASRAAELAVDTKLTGEIGTYLTHMGPFFSPWPDEEQERGRLAAQGAQVVMPTIGTALAKMKSLGQSVDHFLAGQISEKGIWLVFQRATDLVSAVVESSDRERRSANSLAVSKALISGLEDEDPSMRALTAICCGLSIVDQEAIKAHLLNIFVADSNMLARSAAAIPLEHIEGTMRQSRSAIIELAKRFAPDLAKEVGQVAKQGNEEALLDVYRGVVIQHLVGLIARQ